MSARRLSRVLIANRGEIAVRIIRACRDAGLASVAVYADPDRDAPFTHLADEAFPLDGATPQDSYLSVGKLLAAARRSGADAVHPGYGFLAENAGFAEAVLRAGLTWIGPSPEAIRSLGDKVTARHIAARAGAPQAPGTPGPVSGPADVLAFAAEHGYPIAIKAVLGGGGRGLKVARNAAEVPALLESAMREAAAAFGSDACFAERYLDRARHVEAQVLADSHGNIVVAGTRDCTLQRRHQKLVEEAPAPFLTSEQRTVIHESARAICGEAGYHGAATVEYLVAPDGTITFLEVNTRLQVEHPVTEETTGVDLVREQFRIAAGDRLSLDGDPQPHGHAIEFRINGEDPGRGFLPAPGVITRFGLPYGPGVRIDAGVEAGNVVGGQFDSLLAKLIVTGRDRQHALERARRALAEMAVDGIATVLPFHRAVVTDPAFTGNGHGFTVHTRWIETEFHADLPPHGQPAHAGGSKPVAVVAVGGRPLDVSLPAAAAAIVADGEAGRRTSGSGAAAGDVVSSPMQGVVVSITAEPGRRVQSGDLLMVVEAMKMENPVTAHKPGTVTALAVSPGQGVSQGTVLCEIKD